LLQNIFYLLTNALTCFSLSCWPSSRSKKFFGMCSLCASFYSRNSTYD